MILEISNALQVFTRICNPSEKSVVLYGIIGRREQILCERIHTLPHQKKPTKQPTKREKYLSVLDACSL